MAKFYETLRTRLDRHMPPGLKSNANLNTFFTFAVIAALSFVCILCSFCGDLWQTEGYFQKDPANAVTQIETIGDYMVYPGRILAFGFLLQLTTAIQNITYFRRETQSIYVMKRLKSAKTYRKFCWDIPILFAILSILLAILLYISFCIIYFHAVPSGWIPTQTIAFFWRYAL